ncbi:MAG: ABC transporter permease [Candidatus Aquicultor secundus]|nr:MAG: ABC transporter permease [Candidatus Aquicultor secundus]
MHVYTIALKDITRRKGKMALVVAGLAVGVAALVAILTIVLSFQKGIDKKLDTYGFNIVIYPASSNLSLSYGGMTISGVDTYEVKSLLMADLATIKRSHSADSVAALSPKLLQVVDSKDKKALLVGSDFNQEFLIKKWWRLNGSRPTRPDELVLGQDAAKNLQVKAGDTLKLSGKDFKVAAVLQPTGSQDDSLIFGDLREVQSLYKRGGELSLIEISAKSTADIDAVVKDLKKALPQAAVSSIKQAVQYREKAVGSLARFGLAITAVIMLISGLIVFMTMTSSVRDRKREIGIFRAIGYRQSVVARIILTETLILSLIGGAIGYAAGFGIVFMLPAFLKKFEFSVGLNVPVLILSIVLAVAVGLVASLVPALRAANMDPADALKSL